MSTSDHCYHFTHTGALPHILESGELRPHDFGHYPPPAFIWATSNSLGEPNSSAMGDNYRSGVSRLVRFTLPTECFIPWANMHEHFEGWSLEFQAWLISVGKSWASQRGSERASYLNWLVCAQPVPISDVVIESRSYTDKIWRPLPSRDVVELALPPGHSNGRAVKIGSDLFLSWTAEDGTGRVNKCPASEYGL
jgi:hypothetical protein